jgi:hypothetical protein
MIIIHEGKQSLDLDIEPHYLTLRLFYLEVEIHGLAIGRLCPLKLANILTGIAPKVEVSKRGRFNNLQPRQQRSWRIKYCCPTIVLFQSFLDGLSTSF